MRLLHLATAAMTLAGSAIAAITYPILINCGSSSDVTDSEGTWMSDANYAVGGSMRNLSSTSVNPLLRSFRSFPNVYGNNIGYHILVGTEGSYNVTLYFIEPNTGFTSGSRVFSANVEGTTVSNIDIVASAGKLKEHALSFTVTTVDGILDVTFTTSTSTSVVISGIKVDQLSKASNLMSLPLYVNAGCRSSTGCDVEYNGNTYTYDNSAYFVAAASATTGELGSQTLTANESSLMESWVYFGDQAVNVTGTNVYTRTCKVGYNLTVGARGIYQFGVLLHEPDSSATNRRFNIKLNSIPISPKQVDILGLAGSTNSLYEFDVPAVIGSSDNNQVKMNFIQNYPGQGDPLITAFSIREVDAQSAPILTLPIYINAGSNGDYYDQQSNILWMRDNFATGGTRFINPLFTNPVIRSERYFSSDNLGYSIPVGKSGFYQVQLLYSETYFTEGGMRLFDVWIEDVKVVGVNSTTPQVDIYTESGGFGQWYNKTYKDVPVTDGWLDIAFAKNTTGLAGEGNYPKINGIIVSKVTSSTTSTCFMPEGFRTT